MTFIGRLDVHGGVEVRATWLFVFPYTAVLCDATLGRRRRSDRQTRMRTDIGDVAGSRPSSRRQHPEEQVHNMDDKEERVRGWREGEVG